MMQSTLRELTEALAGVSDKALHVRFDFCDLVPTEPDSYRGYYDHLAFGWSDEEPPPTVATALGWLKEANGKTFCGYKGGNFTMGDTTPMWVARWGRAGGTAIVGIKALEWIVYLLTEHQE